MSERGWIYLHEQPGEAYKIGKTKNLRQRDANYKTENPFLKRKDSFHSDDIDAAEQELIQKLRPFQLFRNSKEWVERTSEVLSIWKEQKKKHEGNALADAKQKKEKQRLREQELREYEGTKKEAQRLSERIKAIELEITTTSFFARSLSLPFVSIGHFFKCTSIGFMVPLISIFFIFVGIKDKDPIVFFGIGGFLSSVFGFMMPAHFKPSKSELDWQLKLLEEELRKKQSEVTHCTNSGRSVDDSSPKVIEYEDIPLYTEWHNGAEHKFYA